MTESITVWLNRIIPTQINANNNIIIFKYNLILISPTHKVVFLIFYRIFFLVRSIYDLIGLLKKLKKLYLLSNINKGKVAS